MPPFMAQEVNGLPPLQTNQFFNRKSLLPGLRHQIRQRLNQTAHLLAQQQNEALIILR